MLRAKKERNGKEIQVNFSRKMIEEKINSLKESLYFQIVLMPQEEIDDDNDLDDLSSESLNDLELRARIALLAKALNERASRRF